MHTHEMPTSIMDALERIGEERAKKQQKEYEKLIEENNNH